MANIRLEQKNLDAMRQPEQWVNIKAYMHLLYLALNEKLVSQQTIEAYNLDAVFQLAKNNTLTSLIDWFLEKNGIEHPSFMQARNTVIAHQLILDREEQKLCDFLEANSISYGLLKGRGIKDLYPAFATREMGDIDVLVDPKRLKEVVAWVRSQGYTDEDTIKVNYHQEFTRGSVSLEIHNSLYKYGPTPEWATFTHTVLEHINENHALQTAADISGKSASVRSYGLTKEDQYLVILEHAYRNHVQREIGLRFLVDLWCYQKAYQEVVASDYVRTKLMELGIAAYEKASSELAQACFTWGVSLDTLSEEQIADLLTFIYSDPHGFAVGGCLLSHEDRKQLSGKGWLATYFYILKSLDKREEYFAFNAPFAYRHKWARPFSLLGVSASRLFQHRKQLFEKYGSLWCTQ